MRASVGGTIRRIGYNHFARSATTLAGASVFSQVLTVLAAPLLTRLYAPPDFGVYALFSACLLIAGVIATGQYELALVLPSQRRAAARLFVGAGALAVIVAGMVAGALPLLAEPFSNVVGEANLPRYLWFLPLALWLTAIAKLLRHLRIRERDYVTVARAKIVQSCATVLFQIGLGLWLANAYGLIGALISATLLVAIYLIIKLAGEIRAELIRPSWTEIKTALREYRRFPLLGAPGALLNTLATSIVPILLAATHGLAVAGLYELSARVVQRSFAVLGTSVHQVYWGEAAKRLRDDPPALERLFFGLLVRLFLAALIPTLLLAVLAPQLIALVFGAAWHEAGALVQVMTPLLLARLTIAPLTPMQLLGRQDLMLGLSALRLAIAVASLAGGAWAGLGPVPTVALYAAAVTLSFLVQLGLWIRVLRRTIRDREAAITEIS